MALIELNGPMEILDDPLKVTVDNVYVGSNRRTAQWSDPGDGWTPITDARRIRLARRALRRTALCWGRAEKRRRRRVAYQEKWARLMAEVGDLMSRNIERELFSTVTVTEISQEQQQPLSAELLDKMIERETAGRALSPLDIRSMLHGKWPEDGE